MAYAQNRIIHDADAHVIDTPSWIMPYADPHIRDQIKPLDVKRLTPHLDALEEIERWQERHYDLDDIPDAEREIMTRKVWSAMGSFIKEHRSRALDLLGFSSQLVSTTLLSYYMNEAQHQGDLDFAYGYARAYNRAIVDFCSVDERLLPVTFIPLADFERAADMARDAIAMGGRALLISQTCPPNHAPSHMGLDRVWAQAQEASVPIVFHVRENTNIIDPNYFNNGLDNTHDFLGGGGENYTSVNYMAIPRDAMQTLATMIFDGVLDRFPRLKFGVLEMGASWLPGWMRYMDAAVDAFGKHEKRLRDLSALPSDIVRRQVRVTPYPMEDCDWLIRNCGEELLMFSSDYPHVEGGRNPLKRFESTLQESSEAIKHRFYCDNFLDLVGTL